MFAESETDPSEPAKRWATRNGIAFVAHASNDGTWHGYPEPWNKVPATLVDKWLKAGKMTRKDLRIYDDKASNDLRWALESGDG